MAVVNRGYGKTVGKKKDQPLKLKAVGWDTGPHILPKNQWSLDTDTWPGISFPVFSHRNTQSSEGLQKSGCLIPQMVEIVGEKFQPAILSFTYETALQTFQSHSLHNSSGRMCHSKCLIPFILNALQ